VHVIASTIFNCSITRRGITGGGGAYVDDASVHFTDCQILACETMHGLVGPYGGGGLYVRSGSATLWNSSIAQCSSTVQVAHGLPHITCVLLSATRLCMQGKNDGRSPNGNGGGAQIYGGGGAQIYGGCCILRYSKIIDCVQQVLYTRPIWIPYELKCTCFETGWRRWGRPAHIQRISRPLGINHFKLSCSGES
jgi:hypothetical protein